jgi:transposase
LILLNTWLDIRTRHRDGEAIKEIARTTGSSKNTIKKYLRSNAPPHQASPINRAPLDGSLSGQAQVDELLRVSPTIRAPHILTILRERVDPTFRISERAARVYVASRRIVIAP